MLVLHSKPFFLAHDLKNDIEHSNYFGNNEFMNAHHQINGKLSILNLNCQCINSKFDKIRLFLECINNNNNVSFE